MKKLFIKSVLVSGAAAMLMLFFASCEANKQVEGKSIKGVVVEFERPALKILTIQEIMEKWPRDTGGGGGGDMAAGPGGRGGGVESIPAIHVKNGEYVGRESRKSAVKAGEIKENYASDVNISAEEGNVGGVYVEGVGPEYTVANAEINLSGDGMGLAGMSTGAAANNYGTLVLRNVNVTTSGNSRGATSATNYATLKVYDSTIIAHDAPFEPEYTSTAQKRALEIDGNSRTHVTMSNGYSYFYNSTIIADGWGALSTDAASEAVYLEANNCKIKTVKSGYGAYADILCHDVFNNCEFDSACMAIIMAGQSTAEFRDTKANCGTYFLLSHCVTGSHTEVSTLTVDGGEITCKSPVAIIKSHNVVLKFDDVKVKTESGVLIRSIVNEDPNATPVEGNTVYGIHATFKDMDATGDIIHEDPERTMAVYLENATLKGAVKDAYITLDRQSRWIATGDSTVTIMGDVDVAQIDAPSGVTVNAVATESGTYTLAGGGTLILKAS